MTWSPFRLAQRALDKILGIPSADLTEIDPAEEMDVPEPLARARLALAWQTATRRAGGRVEYGLGFGGKDPDADHPFQWDPKTRTWRCDCSGLTNWCNRTKRQDPVTKRWRNTDEYHRMARLEGRTLAQAVPGDTIAYGAGKAIGHCGIKADDDQIIHCASKTAIVQTGMKLFERKGALPLRQA